MEREPREHLDLRAALQHESLDDIEAVAIGHPARHEGQVPAARWRGPADAALAVEGPAALEDPPDGPHGGWWAPRGHGPLPLDGAGAVFPERARVAELVAQPQHVVLHRRRGPDKSVRNGRLARPVHAVQTFPPGAGHPPLHRAQADLEGAGHGPEGVSGLHSGYHCATSNLTTVFLAMPPLLLSTAGSPSVY